jgi:hypothetical protein
MFDYMCDAKYMPELEANPVDVTIGLINPEERNRHNLKLYNFRAGLCGLEPFDRIPADEETYVVVPSSSGASSTEGTVMSMTTDKKIISRVSGAALSINVPATTSTRADHQEKWENYAKEIINIIGRTFDSDRKEHLAIATSMQSPISILVAYMRTIGDAAIAQELMKEYSEGKSPPKVMSLIERGTLTITGDSVLGFKNKKGSTFADNAMRDLLDPANQVFNTNGWIGAQAWRATFGWPEGFGNTIYLKHLC